MIIKTIIINEKEHTQISAEIGKKLVRIYDGIEFGSPTVLGDSWHTGKRITELPGDFEEIDKEVNMNIDFEH